jgi:hypothetical protein
VVSDQTTRRYETGGTVSYSAEPCFSDGRPSSERRVQVMLKRNSSINALIFNQNIGITGKSVARFEALAG